MAVVLFLGFILTRKKVISDTGRRTLTDLLLKAVLPFTIISSSQYAYSDGMMRSIVAVAAGAMLYYLISLITLRLIVWKTKSADSEKRVLVTTSVFANTGFVGMPIMYSLFGDGGLLLAAIYNLIYNLFFYTYGVHLLSRRKPSVREYLNPVSVASVLAVILFMIPWRAPSFVVNAVDLVGGMTFPLSMIIMGSTLSTINIKNLFTDKRSYVVSFLRLILFPVLMAGAIILVKRFVPVAANTALTLILMTALPSGTMNVIYSEMFDCAPKFCARTVTLTLVCMVVTMPVIITLGLVFFFIG